MDLHAELMVGLVAAAAWLMTKAGLGKNALELRRRRVTCPSCGRYDGCSCR
jgi:hypothetical protein